MDTKRYETVCSGCIYERSRRKGVLKKSRKKIIGRRKVRFLKSKIST